MMAWILSLTSCTHLSLNDAMLGASMVAQRSYSAFHNVVIGLSDRQGDHRTPASAHHSSGSGRGDDCRGHPDWVFHDDLDMLPDDTPVKVAVQQRMHTSVG